MNGHATLETQRREQVDRERDIERFRKFKVTPEQRGRNAEREKQHGWRQQIGRERVEKINVHGLSVEEWNFAGVEVVDSRAMTRLAGISRFGHRRRLSEGSAAGHKPPGRRQPRGGQWIWVDEAMSFPVLDDALYFHARAH
jgi:hypothetical protein